MPLVEKTNCTIAMYNNQHCVSLPVNGTGQKTVGGRQNTGGHGHSNEMKGILSATSSTSLPIAAAPYGASLQQHLHHPPSAVASNSSCALTL